MIRHKDRAGSRLLWNVDNWRCVLADGWLLLYVDRLQVARRPIQGRRDVDRYASAWQRSVELVIDLEAKSWRLP
jgi:hypothetical protein